MALGLDTKKVILTAYDEDWENQFIITKKEIEAILGDNVVGVYYIGSTAIKSITAKPILDVGVMFKSVERLNIAGMESAGYVYGRNKYVPEDYEFFKYADESRNIGTHHIHCYLEGHDEPLKANILFCVYLNAHPCTAKQYNDLKLSLASVYSNDRAAYLKGKTDFVNKVVKLAEKSAV